MMTVSLLLRTPVMTASFFPPVAHGSTVVKNAWRLNNKTKDKWYIIYAKTPESKQEWMEAFDRERQRVKEDEEKGGYEWEHKCKILHHVVLCMLWTVSYRPFFSITNYE